MKEGWLDGGGVRLHYLEWKPDGPSLEPALLLLHGLGSNARFWERIAARLPDRRVVALDQRSHGRSDRPPAGYSYDELAGDAARAISQLALGRPLVVGHSWGATVALEVAARHPELASGFVNVDGPMAGMSRWLAWEQMAARMQPPFPVHADLAAAAAAQAAYLGTAWGDDLQDFVAAGVVETEGGYHSTLTPEVRLQILRAMYEQEPADLYPRVAGPVLLAAAGEYWEGAPPEFRQWKERAASAAQESRADAQVRWYESRHDIPLIRPAELAGDIERTALAAAFWDVWWRAAGLDGDWQRPAHGDVAGWTAKDLLAHLSSTLLAVGAIAKAGSQPPDPGAASRPPFDPDRWNASQVRRRQETPVPDLVAELRVGAVAIQAGLLEATLDGATTIGRFTGLPLREAMVQMARHQRSHLGDLGRALQS